MSSPVFRHAWSVRLHTCFLTVVATAVCLSPNATQALVSSFGGSNAFTGQYINEFIGADVFYDRGFGGQNTIVASIEAGTIWSGHETLQGRISSILTDPSITGTQLGEADWHATMVGHAIGGRGLYTYQVGIAPFATLWSGSMATSWNATAGEAFTGSFSISESSFLSPFRQAMMPTSGSAKADVLNGSWGFADPSGSDPVTITLDAMMRSSGTLGVFAAGNEGPISNSVGAPGSGFNGISVAALTNSRTHPEYDQVASFSSRGPNDFFNPISQTTTPAVRPAVDIAAPGDNLTLAFYGGSTGGNVSGIDYAHGRNDLYITEMGGTSFAAPIVAGAAALMIDVAKVYGVRDMSHPLVTKSILMASAHSLADWDNGQRNIDNIVRTTQALDYSTGAGVLDLANAYQILVGSSQLIAPGIFFNDTDTTLGIDGANGGSAVGKQGWDLGSIRGGSNIYTLAGRLAAGSQFSAALTWYAERTFGPTLDSASDVALSNLALELWRIDSSHGDRMVARSEAPVSTSELLRLKIEQEGFYQFRVVFDGQNYNRAASPDLNTPYGIAWMTTIPEPSTTLLVLLAFWPRRRRSTSDARSLATLCLRGATNPSQPNRCPRASTLVRPTLSGSDHSDCVP